MRFSNVIFDMDGTLWDAVDSYAEIWNVAAKKFGIDRLVRREDLLDLMGMTIDRIFKRLYPEGTVPQDIFLTELDKLESKLMPVLGGKLYPDVRKGIELLSRSKNLYMVSNCGKDGLHNFLDFTGLKPFFKDTLAYGENNCGKAHNIREIMNRNNISDAVYVGDTSGDCKAAHEAGIPMIHVTYGFGTAPDAEFSASNFDELTEILLKNE